MEEVSEYETIQFLALQTYIIMYNMRLINVGYPMVHENVKNQ